GLPPAVCRVGAQPGTPYRQQTQAKSRLDLPRDPVAAHPPAAGARPDARDPPRGPAPPAAAPAARPADRTPAAPDHHAQPRPYAGADVRSLHEGPLLGREQQPGAGHRLEAILGPPGGVVLAQPLPLRRREAAVDRVGCGDSLPVVLEVTADAVAAFQLEMTLL